MQPSTGALQGAGVAGQAGWLGLVPQASGHLGPGVHRPRGLVGVSRVLGGDAQALEQLALLLLHCGQALSEGAVLLAQGGHGRLGAVQGHLGGERDQVIYQSKQCEVKSVDQ